MSISIDTAIKFGLGSIIGYFSRIFVEHMLVKSRAKEGRKIEAAQRFRSRIFTELEGLYPVTQYWDKGVFYRFPQSIAKIESAAVEFRLFIRRKAHFDAAVKRYCKCCNEITWDRCAAWSMYPSMRKEGEIDPKDKFTRCVEALLSFAKEI